jgi:hypothetical protein
MGQKKAQEGKPTFMTQAHFDLNPASKKIKNLVGPDSQG